MNGNPERTKYVENIKRELSRLAELAANADGWGKTQWTLRLKSALVELGESEFELVACARGANKHHGSFGEWLFDVCWLNVYEKHEDNGYDTIKSLELAVESEWGNFGDIDDDFEKLMVSRAELRLMIFDNDGKDRSDIPACLEQLKKKLNAYAGSKEGDQYLVAVYRCCDEKGDRLKPYRPEFLFYTWRRGEWQSA